jgi:ABC-type ATPase with predicted acetyltransferase domain
MKLTHAFTRSRKSACEPTPEVVAVAQMFGLGVDKEHEVVLYKDLEVTIGTGRVVFLTGESGAGKTSLLSDIKELAKGEASGFTVIEPLTVDRIPDRPLINLFDDLQEALELFTFSGLSEAFVMLRKPRELSDGQRYRLTLALAMAQARRVQNPIIFMDEFLANLDRVTARAVAYSVRKVASKTGICFVLATTHDDILRDLNPNQVITMENGQQPRIDRRVIP